MKAERRQELKTNELAQMLEDTRDFFKKYGSYVVGGVLVVVLVVVVVLFRGQHTQQALAESWKAVNEVKFVDESGALLTEQEIEDAFTALDDLAGEVQNQALLFEIFSRKASAAMMLATDDPQEIKEQYLDKAEEAFKSMQTKLKDHNVAQAQALSGLADVESNRFVLDGNLERKETARKYLEQLKQERFNGLPYQASATDRLNNLDDVFRKVELAEAPPQPAAAQQGAQPIPLGELTGQKPGQPRRVPMPEGMKPRPGQPQPGQPQEAAKPVQPREESPISPASPEDFIIDTEPDAQPEAQPEADADQPESADEGQGDTAEAEQNRPSE